jgi:hypothetical protein
MAVARRLLTAETRFRSQASPCEICGGQSGTGTGFSPITSVLHYQYHSTTAPYSSSSTRRSYQKAKFTKPGNLPKSNALSEIEERWIEEYGHLSVFEGLTV